MDKEEILCPICQTKEVSSNINQETNIVEVEFKCGTKINFPLGDINNISYLHRCNILDFKEKEEDKKIIEVYINKITSLFKNKENNLSEEQTILNEEIFDDIEIEKNGVILKNGVLFVQESHLELKNIDIEIPEKTLVYIIEKEQFLIRGPLWWIALKKNIDLLEIDFVKITNLKGTKNEDN